MFNRSLFKLMKYDFIVFFREPFFALPIMLLPGLFFYIFMSIYQTQLTGGQDFSKYIPTYALLISFLVLFFNIGMQFVTEKERGIHKRLMLSSITKSYIVVAYLVRGVLLSLMGLIEIIVIARLGFNMTLSNQMISFVLLFVVMVGILLLISLSIHDLFKNTRQVLPLTIITFQYVLFCSGLMFPISKSPEFLKWLVYINPFYHMNSMLGKVWVGEYSSISWINPSYLLMIMILCLLLVAFNNRKKES